MKRLSYLIPLLLLTACSPEDNPIPPQPTEPVVNSNKNKTISLTMETAAEGFGLMATHGLTTPMCPWRISRQEPTNSASRTSLTSRKHQTIISRKAMSLGFWVEHLNEDHSKDPLADYVVNIDKLEELTGIDFFCNLPDDLETKVESATTDEIKKDWGL